MKLAASLIITLVIVASLFTGCDKPKNEGKTASDVNKDTTEEQGLRNFLFLSKYYGKVGVYNYDLSEKKYETVWWNPRENVTLLITKPGDNPAFFLTAGKMGTRGNFPFFERIKIYRINPDLSGTENIYKTDSGMQITSRWNSDGNLEVLFTAIDKVDPSYINKYTKTFDNYGRLIDDEMETYDIIKDGFPELLPKRKPTVSISGKYGITFSGDTVFLKTTDNDSLLFITVAQHKIQKVSWSNDEKFLFLSTLDLNNETAKTKKPQTSELFVYSVEHDSVTAYWDGGGIKNFFTFDSLIVFDDGFGRNSVLNVYNFVRGKVITQIRMKTGCGLFYIPEY